MCILSPEFAVRRCETEVPYPAFDISALIFDLKSLTEARVSTQQVRLRAIYIHLIDQQRSEPSCTVNPIYRTAEPEAEHAERRDSALNGNGGT